MEANDTKRCIAALRAGIELGLTHIDTAELCGAGEVETRVGDIAELGAAFSVPRRTSGVPVL